MVRYYKRKRNKSYSTNDLNQSILMKKSGCSFREASVRFNVPLGTLYNHFNRKHEKKIGHPTALTFEEEQLVVSSLKYCSENGYPCDRKDLRNIVKNYSTKCPHALPWVSSPGNDFLCGFEKRWKNQLTKRKPEILTANRIRSLSKDSLEAYFETTKTIYDQNLLHDCPERIFNLDETGLVVDQWARKCFFKRGTKKAVVISPTCGKTMHTLLVCVSASGQLLPPCVIYKGKNLYDAWTQNCPNGTSFFMTKSGWIDADVFKSWFSEVIN